MTQAPQMPDMPEGAEEGRDAPQPRRGVAPALSHRLSTRIVASSLVALVVVLGMIAWTLWLSWQLEGAAAAINDAGSLRMRANRVGVELLQPGPDRAVRVRGVLDDQAEVLARLHDGNPSRPLFLPEDPAIRAQMGVVGSNWKGALAPAVEAALAQGANGAYLAALPHFVAEADRLVRMIEQDNAGKTNLLRFSQGVLIAIACVGTMAMITLFYLWIVLPVWRLRDGLERMAAREFAVRLPVESRDEFGVLAKGFNRMADELQGLYADLEERVRDKTRQLEGQNRELGALYDMASFLIQPNEIEPMCRGFLQRVMAQFGAEGGSIRMLDPVGEKLHLLISEGLSPELEEHEYCMRTDACFCGEAARKGVVEVVDFRSLPMAEGFGCTREGFASLAAFRIVAPSGVLGSFSLHFRVPRVLPPSDTHLLEALGQHLGVALDNRRLSAKERQLAVAEERNLVAQGLHDSIAQGLNFLNLQVQMLEDAARRQAPEEIEEILPLLRTGVEESYQDVRELLLNFRAKLGQGELRAAIEDTVARFRRQTGLETSLAIDDPEGAPLPPEQQLQVLFILQEALSNIRKHAEATRVAVHVSNQRDFEMEIRDDGQGFDAAEVARRGERHLGLAIMQERAARLNASLVLDSAPGAGTRVQLVLPRSERQAA